MMKSQVPVELPAVDAEFVDDGTRFFDADEMRLMASIGFMAAKSGCLVPAIRIFEALSLLRPRAAFPFIGMAIAYISVGMGGEAVYVLRDRAMAACEDRAELELWLCLALQQAGNHAAALAEFGHLMSHQPQEELSPLARRLAGLLGVRSAEPEWPTPAPVSDVPLESTSD